MIVVNLKIELDYMYITVVFLMSFFYMNKLYFLDKTIYGVNFTIFVINYNRTIKDHACHIFQKILRSAINIFFFRIWIARNVFMQWT